MAASSSVYLRLSSHSVCASSFGDHAVLQQAPAQAVVWGFAPAALGVTLTLAGGGLSSKLYGRLQPFNATAYTWRVSLPPMPHPLRFLLLRRRARTLAGGANTRVAFRPPPLLRASRHA